MANNFFLVEFTSLPRTPMREQGLCDQCWCPFIHVIHVCDKHLNGILEVDSSFEILAVDFSSNL